MKLQCNVSDSFAEVLDPALQKAALEKDPGKKPPKLSNLIPTALLDYAETQLGLTVDPALREEATEILIRKPGPQKKKPLESHDLFDERPGTWLSNVAIATGCAMVTCGDKSLSLAGCHVPTTAAERAVEQGWGAIPEVKETSNGPLPGIRFIPPGVDLAPKATPAPLPMALADVGAWVSEASIFSQSTLVLADGRTVQFSGSGVPEDAILIQQAMEPKVDPIPDDSPEPLKIAHKNAAIEARRRAIMRSIATAQVSAYEIGWTARRETRKGIPGILLIPPRVRLTYEIAPGRTIPVMQ